MALKDLVIPTVEVVFAGGSFPVRGLSRFDIEILMRDHGNDLKTIWDEFLADGTDLTKLDLNAVGPLLHKLVSRIPRAVVDMVALAADADAEDKVKLEKLGIGVQVMALGKVLGITLGTDGDWAKTIETAITMLKGANGAVAQLANQQAEG